MKSRISDAVRLNDYAPVAVMLTDDRPERATQFKKNQWGCVATLLVAASKGRTAVFDRDTFGCVGGGVGLGFGDQYGEFPIDYLLSTGNGVAYRDRGHRTHLTEGERSRIASLRLLAPAVNLSCMDLRRPIGMSPEQS